MSHPVSWREAVIAYLREEAKPVEKFSHQPRLYALTREIADDNADDATRETFDDDVLFAAAYLHDLGVFIGHRPEDAIALAQWDNTRYAVEQTPAILRRFGFPEAKIPAVLDCIANHQPDKTPTTPEATVLRDADILEQLGAVGILRTVCKIGRDTRFHTFADAERSLTRALETLPSQLRLQKAKDLAAPRIALLRSFLENLRNEASSEL